MFTVTRFVNTSQLKRSLFQDSRKHSPERFPSRILFFNGLRLQKLAFRLDEEPEMKEAGRPDSRKHTVNIAARVYENQ